MSQMVEEIIAGMNEQQRAATTTESAHALVVAGPGAGKTRVLTTRVAWLIEHGVHPSRILAITFTNKAAAEMRDRIEPLVGRKVLRQIAIGTFHGTCLRILRKHGHRLGYSGETISVYDEVDRRDILKAVIADLRSKMSMKKLDIATTDIACRAKPFHELNDAEQEVLREYRERLRESNAVDFSGILLETNRLFDAFPDVLAQYHDEWHHVMIDEYQDTDRTQYNLHHRLAPRNLFCIGDPDQAIYAFRGADQSIILQFEQDHQGASIYRLDTNYRSTHPIVNGSMNLIRNNVSRIANDIKATRDGCPVRIIPAADQVGQAIDIGRDIAQARERGDIAAWSDTALLYRKNRSALELARALEGLDVPFQVLTSEREFYGIDEVHRFISLLRAIANPHDHYSVMRIVNWPEPRINSQDLRAMRISAIEAECTILDVMRESDAYRNHTAVIASLHELVDAATAAQIAEQANADLGISAWFESRSLATRATNVKTLIHRVAEWCAGQPPHAMSINTYLEWFALRTQQDSLKKDQDSVKLLTIHGAKGLEWKRVYIVDATQHDFLPGRADQSVEEERRVFYVAATRAAEHLYICYPRGVSLPGDGYKQCEPVQFILEMEATQ